MNSCMNFASAYPDDKQTRGRGGTGAKSGIKPNSSPVSGGYSAKNDGKTFLDGQMS